MVLCWLPSLPAIYRQNIPMLNSTRITDFGLAVVTYDLDLIRNIPAELGDHTCWIAPEIVDGRGDIQQGS